MFNYFDVITVMVIGAGAYFGIITGIIASLFYIASGFAGMFIAQYFSPAAAWKFYLYFAMGTAAMILIGFFISRLARTVFLGLFDRIGGAVLGVLVGLAVVALVLIPLSSHAPKKMKKAVFSSYTASTLVPRMQKIFPKVRQFTFEDIKDALPLEKFPRKLNIDLPKLK